MTDWKAIRARFPAVLHQVYLNTAGGGPMSLDAISSVKRYYDEFYEHGDTRWSARLDQVERTRRRLADFLGARPEEIAFLGNASQGLNFVAAILDGTGEVITLAGEFPSVTLPWLQRRRRLRFVGSEAELDAAIGPESTVAALSLAQYKSGARLDLHALSRLCAAREVRLVVDATQAFGVQSIDVSRTPVDALVFSGYKWANAGYGIAALYIGRELLRERGLPAAGWRSALSPYGLDERGPELTSEARGLELGHPPFAGVASLDGALELIERIGIDAIEQRVGGLVARLHERLAENGHIVTSPPGSAITMVSLPDPEAAAAALGEKRILVSARGEALRVSVHYYNDEGDIDAFIEALGSV